MPKLSLGTQTRGTTGGNSMSRIRMPVARICMSIAKQATHIGLDLLTVSLRGSTLFRLTC